MGGKIIVESNVSLKFSEMRIAVMLTVVNKDVVMAAIHQDCRTLTRSTSFVALDINCPVRLLS